MIPSPSSSSPTHHSTLASVAAEPGLGTGPCALSRLARLLGRAAAVTWVQSLDVAEEATPACRGAQPGGSNVETPVHQNV